LGGRGRGRFLDGQFRRLRTRRLGWRLWILHTPDERTNGGQENSHYDHDSDKHHQIAETNPGTRHNQFPEAQIELNEPCLRHLVKSVGLA
jgi:hypothetical protein